MKGVAIQVAAAMLSCCVFVTLGCGLSREEYADIITYASQCTSSDECVLYTPPCECHAAYNADRIDEIEAVRDRVDFCNGDWMCSVVISDPWCKDGRCTTYRADRSFHSDLLYACTEGWWQRALPIACGGEGACLAGSCSTVAQTDCEIREVHYYGPRPAKPYLSLSLALSEEERLFTRCAIYDASTWRIDIYPYEYWYALNGQRALCMGEEMRVGALLFTRVATDLAAALDAALAGDAWTDGAY